MYVVYYCCILVTMLHSGLVGSACMSCSIVAVWRPCIVQVLSAMLCGIVAVKLIISFIYLQRSVEKFCMKRKHLKAFKKFK